MKKRLACIAAAAVMTVAALGMFGCASNGSNGSQASSAGSDSSTPSGQISVYSREDGSGTRSAFTELFGIEQKDASGNKVDMTTTSAVITNSTSVMMTSIAGDDKGIGYISLGSLNDSVKALEIDGVEASAENVKNGSYKIARPFNIVVKENLPEAAQDFVNFIMSKDGQTIVEDNGYIEAASSSSDYAASGISGKVVVAGSSSVTPVMEKLAEAYEALNPGVAIEVQQSDSTTGVTMATEGTCDIGMASRELKDSEQNKGVTSQVIAQDGIAVIVAPDFAVDSLTQEQVMDIFMGNIADWGQI